MLKNDYLELWWQKSARKCRNEVHLMSSGTHFSPPSQLLPLFSLHFHFKAQPPRFIWEVDSWFHFSQEEPKKYHFFFIHTSYFIAFYHNFGPYPSTHNQDCRKDSFAAEYFLTSPGQIKGSLNFPSFCSFFHSPTFLAEVFLRILKDISTGTKLPLKHIPK